MASHSGPLLANSFHAGSTCPFCQETITEGQLVVKCEACGSLQHELCWHHNQGCASYHCDKKVRRGDGIQPELTVTASELENVVVPPKPARKGALEAARPFLPDAPRRRSWLALSSLALAALALLGLVAAYFDSLPGVVAAIVTALAAMVLGMIALVAINTGRKVHGMAYAATGVLLGGVMVVVCFLSLRVSMQTQFRDTHVNLQMSESRPTEADLGRLAPPRAEALRANVVITCVPAHSFTGGIMVGSGVVVRMENHQVWILTNRHVIGAGESAELDAVRGKIEVLFYNGERSEAKAVWLAPDEADLAIVSCSALTPEKIVPIQLAAEIVTQGQPVFAVGNPQGLSWSYTEGVISGVRSRQQGSRQLEVYQTQTPINFGNSGGGLYTMAGQLVGINTWTRDKAVEEGLSFAISSRAVLDLLGADGRRRFLAGAVTEPARPVQNPAEVKAEAE